MHKLLAIWLVGVGDKLKDKIMKDIFHFMCSEMPSGVLKGPLF